MTWDLVVVLARGSAWILLLLSFSGLLMVAGYGSLELVTGQLRQRRDRVAVVTVTTVLVAAAWIGLAYAAGGGTVNP